MRFPLDVFGQLTLTVDGQDVLVRGEGAVIAVEFPTFGVWLHVLRRLSQATPLLRGLATRADLGVVLLIRGQRVGELRREAGPLARLLGLPPVALDLGGLLRALLRR
jgi:hypothetical protein